MKLGVFSDLHLDANRRHRLVLPVPCPEHDAALIAGDVCQGGIEDGPRLIVEAGSRQALNRPRSASPAAACWPNRRVRGPA
jgi:hypothetical protein